MVLLKVEKIRQGNKERACKVCKGSLHRWGHACFAWVIYGCTMFNVVVAFSCALLRGEIVLFGAQSWSRSV